MISSIKYFLLTGLGIFCCIGNLFAQNIHANSNLLFYQLNTANGLTDNYINSMVVDKTGNLWIATGEGLNMFNGKTVVKFFNQEYPELRSDNIRQVLCDKSNRVWVMTGSGDITVIDNQRKFHRLGLYKNGKPLLTRWMQQTATHDISLFTWSALYVLNPETIFKGHDSLRINDFRVQPMAGCDTLFGKTFSQVQVFDDNSYLLAAVDGVYKLNYASNAFEKKYAFTGKTLLSKWEENGLLVYDVKANQLQLIDLLTEKISLPFKGMKDQHGDTIAAVFTRARKINDNQLLLATRKAGFYIYNFKTSQLLNYRHNAADPTTIINNSPVVITKGNDGWIFLGASPNGISYYNSNAVIGQQTVFQDRKGNSYDGYINTITTKDNDKYFISTSDNLIQWTRSTNATEFVDYARVNGRSLVNNEEVYHAAFDNLGHLWVATLHYGIYILDDNKKILKQLQHDTARLHSIPERPVQCLQMSADGYMWISGGSGLCRVNPVTFEVQRFSDPVLSRLNNEHCYRTWFSDVNNIWICTRRLGLWNYNFSTKALKIYDEKNLLISNDVLTVNKDKNNNIYAGTALGLTILFTNGTSRSFAVKDGLLNKRAEALLLDKQGRMWIGNDVGLACFNIKDTSIKVFDERYGLSIQGFRVNSYHQNSDDELIWGTEKGLQYFYPDDLITQKINFTPTINRVETRSIFSDLTQSDTFNLAASDNYVIFYFTSIDYSTHLRTFYEYKLEGLDKDWIKVIDQDFVRYSSLQPGTYTFKVRASNDGKLWKDSENSVMISIAKPIWQQWWFKVLGLITGLLLIWYVINYYRKKQLEQREELETEAVVNYFASQINSCQSADEILRDVVKNCISKLNFEDCVIYLLDEERNVLVQRAAYGAKSKDEFNISEPIELPVGKAIVGSVAKTGKPEIIANTDNDERYIVDDIKRHSEIAVPLIMDGKVIGVIDSEHPKRNYFTDNHLKILSAIGVLAANQLERARVEEAKQIAEKEVMLNRQKVAESRLQSLRLQMNPHFLFNALNSIQQMILANEEMIATRYLSRFSKLLRTILVHSDKEMVTLKEEIEILNLYVELESVRFKDKFTHRVVCDAAIDCEEIKIPTLLVQPFVENAIWHGLMHKEGMKELLVEFSEENNFIKCVVEDNGIGRARSGELKISTGQGTKHKSKGIEVSIERLKNMRNASGQTGEIHITDLKDDAGNGIGTRVELFFPV